ncbi:MAG: DNA-3-methyladenine glycosylase [Gammaproteobacteria bacterium]|nr:DNA-3-methyladenine glycosylase [Gammaproteobacteria bacterium]
MSGAANSSLGRTPSRAALFDPPGTIYMYYARGPLRAETRSIFRRRERANGVLGEIRISRDGRPFARGRDQRHATKQSGHPGSEAESTQLCKGQTLMCRALGLSVTEWNRQMSSPDDRFRLHDDGYRPSRIIQCRRLGIPPGRDEHLPWRFIDAGYARCCTSNPPLAKRGAEERRQELLAMYDAC